MKFDFIKEIPRKMMTEKKIRIRLRFYERNPFKMNRTKQKVHQKIEITFNLMRDILLKFIRNKNKLSLQLCRKNTTAKLGTIFENSRRSRVNLKIIGATFQHDQNFKPTRKLTVKFLYIIHI